MEPSISLNRVSLSYPVAAHARADDAARPAEPQAAAENLARAWAVADLSLELRAGERVGIIGRNGAGKSSLLSMICGVIMPTSGDLQVHGEVQALLTLGTAMRDELTGRENIYLDGELKGETRQQVERNVEDIIAYADLGEFIDNPVRTYSSGMKARLAFSMIIKLQPEILLIDEALSVGDIHFNRKASRTIRDICARGRIVVIVSHSLGSIVELCDRCIWLEAGRIVRDGAPADVTSAYREQVQSDDQVQARRSARRLLETSEIRRGGQIDQVSIEQSPATSMAALSTGVATRVTFTAAASGAAAGAVVRITIRRLDGIPISEFELLVDEQLARRMRVAPVPLALVLEPLILSTGVYLIAIELAQAGAVIARSSIEAEVRDQAIHVGGVPMLNVPIRIRPRADARG